MITSAFVSVVLVSDCVFRHDDWHLIACRIDQTDLEVLRTVYAGAVVDAGVLCLEKGPGSVA